MGRRRPDEAFVAPASHDRAVEKGPGVWRPSRDEGTKSSSTWPGPLPCRESGWPFEIMERLLEYLGQDGTSLDWIARREGKQVARPICRSSTVSRALGSRFILILFD